MTDLTEALLRRIDCTRFIVSTNGDFFQHPDRDTIDLITENAPRQTPPTIVFNYDTATTTRYRSDHRLVASYGTDGRAVVTSPAVGMVGTRIYPHRA